MQLVRSAVPKATLASLVAGLETASQFRSMGEGVPTPSLSDDEGPPEDLPSPLTLLPSEDPDEPDVKRIERILTLSSRYPEFYSRLIEIGKEVSYLHTYIKPLLTIKSMYIEHAFSRRVKVVEQLKQAAIDNGEVTQEQAGWLKLGPGGVAGLGKAKGKQAQAVLSKFEVCGYDRKFAWGDEEFLEWVGESLKEHGIVSQEELKVFRRPSGEGRGAGEGSLSSFLTNNTIDFSKLDSPDAPIPEDHHHTNHTHHSHHHTPSPSQICTKRKCGKHLSWEKVRFEEVQLEERLWEEKVQDRKSVV